MDITKSREEFEKWWDTYKSRFFKDQYEPFKRIAWEAWQDSRLEIEFELPKSGFYLGYESPEYMEKDDVIEACGTAGIRIKGNEKS
ncbi:hypothetical protein [Yersinia kristensenii]|uniref:hypothetical protein n=1 Tax=Yersinia kristensenii TaxID=28152 RepID=UPI00119D8A37|nr:hypothetical protein [Yersinia kristensenii]